MGRFYWLATSIMWWGGGEKLPGPIEQVAACVQSQIERNEKETILTPPVIAIRFLSLTARSLANVLKEQL